MYSFAWSGVFAALRLDDFFQRGVHVFRHSFGVAADEEMRAFAVEPLPKLGRVFLHAMLHVDLLLLVARESAIDPRQKTFALHLREFVLVKIIAASRAASRRRATISRARRWLCVPARKRGKARCRCRGRP